MTKTQIVKKAVDALVERAKRELDEGLLPSCQIALGLDGEVVEQFTLGDHLGEDSRYVIFSATKGLIYGTMFQLLGENKITLDQTVADVIPEFAGEGKEKVTIGQVMTHRGGFPLAPMHPDKWQDRAKRLECYAGWKLTHEPGTFLYHATAAHWVLAEILEAVDGIDYKKAFRQRILEPLGLKRTQLGLPLEDTKNINLPVLVGEAATPEEFEAAIGVKGIDPGEVTDDNAVASAQPEYLAGGLPGGGGVGTAGDLALYYQALLHNPKKLWDPKWLERCTQEVCNTDWDLLFAAPANRTIGMVVAGDDGRAGARGFGKTNSPRAFGYNGYGGQLAWADPETGLSFSYLTNGIDRHLLRQTRRGVGIGSRAALCAA